MRKIFTVAFAAATLAFATTAAAALGASASGSGSIHFGSSAESLSFSAMQQVGTLASGHAVIRDLTAAGEVTVMVDVNCLNVIGNIAVVSGTVVRSSNPTAVPVGDTAYFAVQDNGEGGSAVGPDLMTLANFYAPGTGPDCNAVGDLDFAPIESGNFQVRP
jgi:hypothetical protein